MGTMAGESILIVDDNPTNLKLARVILEGESYSVVTAENAEQALEVLDQMQPDLILMDLQLPGMDGLTLTSRLRRDERWKNTTIVALTAYAMKGDAEKAALAGCDGYITKPIEPPDLTSAVAAYLARKRVAH